MVWIPPGYELAPEAAPGQRRSHLWDYIFLVWHRRWLVALVFIFCTGLATLMTLRAQPIYEGLAKLRVEPDVPKILSFDNAAGAQVLDYRTDFTETQRQMVQNRVLARQVVEQLNLYADDGFGGGQKSLLRSFMAYLNSFATPQEAIPRTPADPETARMRDRVDAFLSCLSVSQLRDTQILEIRFLDADPARSAEVANAICSGFIRWNHKTRMESYNATLDFLKQKQDELKGKLEQSEESLYKFAGGKDILPLADATSDLSKQLAETGLKLADAERQMFDKKFDLQALESKTTSGLIFPSDPRVQKMLSDLSELEVRYDQLKAQLGPAMGEVKSLEAAKKRLENQIAEERRKLLDKARVEYGQAKAGHEFLKNSYDLQRKRIVEVQQRLIQYNILKREADVNRELYNSLLQRWKEVGVTSGLKTGNVTIVEPADPPKVPKLPRKKRNVFMGGFVGLFLGIALVFFLDYMDTSVKTSEEVESIAQLATLAHVPHHDTRQPGQPDTDAELAMHEKPASALAESIRYLRTSIMYSLAGRSPKTILVTSAFPGEGKTTVAINLAIAYAQRGHKVLLVDADLKRPGLHKFFPVDCSKGLTEVLTGKSNGAAVAESHISNLFLLPSGSKAPNPVDLLDSDVMRDLLVSLSETYDQIVIDSCPLAGMADTAVLVPYVDGVVLVVQPGKTPRHALRNAKEQVVGMQGRILGVVLNNPRLKSVHPHGYGYGYGYGRYYQYGEVEDQSDEDREPINASSRSSAALPPPNDRPDHV